MLEGVGFSGAAGSVIRVFAPSVTALPLFVVGIGANPDATSVRDAIGAAVRTTTGFDTLAVSAPTAPALVRAVAEGVVLGGYRFQGYKRDAGKTRASRVVIAAPEVPAESDQRVVAAVGQAVALVKDLVHTPAEWLGPQDLADRAVEAAAGLPVSVDVFDEQRLAEEGYGGILGVGQGSDRPPRLVRVEYAPEGATRHIALVGKGITFDTGGLSLKPPRAWWG